VCLVPTALARAAAPLRPEEGLRDHKPRLGLEDGRAWPPAPLLRTFQLPLVARRWGRL
jgi:hypothetical protein